MRDTFSNLHRVSANTLPTTASIPPPLRGTSLYTREALAWRKFVPITVKLMFSIRKRTIFGRWSSGGNMWESNPPGRFLAPHNGFEDRGTHRRPYTPILVQQSINQSPAAAAGSFGPTFAYKSLEIHKVFLRLLTQNLSQNLSPAALADCFIDCCIITRRGTESK